MGFLERSGNTKPTYKRRRGPLSLSSARAASLAPPESSESLLILQRVHWGEEGVPGMKGRVQGGPPSQGTEALAPLLSAKPRRRQGDRSSATLIFLWIHSQLGCLGREGSLGREEKGLKINPLTLRNQSHLLIEVVGGWKYWT